MHEDFLEHGSGPVLEVEQFAVRGLDENRSARADQPVCGEVGPLAGLESPQGGDRSPRPSRRARVGRF